MTPFAPVADPELVAVKHEFLYSFTSLVGNIGYAIGANVFFYRMIENAANHFEAAPVAQTVLIAVCLGVIASSI